MFRSAVHWPDLYAAKETTRTVMENKRILRIVTRRDRTFVGDGEGGGASESAGTGSYEDELMFPLSQSRSHGYGHWQLFCGRCRQPYPHNHMHVTCRVATCSRSASTATPRAAPWRHFRAAARPEPGYAAHNDLGSVSIPRPCCSYSIPGKIHRSEYTLPRKPPQQRLGKCNVADEQELPVGASFPVWRYTS